MKESYIQRLFAERLGGRRFGKDTTIYKFEKIKRAKRAALKKNPRGKIIDMGVGEPDEMAFPQVVSALKKECARPENRMYADNGIPEFKEAAARYMNRVFGVKNIDPATEVNHCIGAKSALAMIPAALINPGDICLMTVPGYPVLGTHSTYYGGEVINLPLLQKRGFLPDLNPLPRQVKSRAKLLYLNYPNNPTGAAATPGFFKKVVRFAKENKVVVIHDAAYSDLTFSGKPLSFLSIPGAKEVGIEIHSLSKSYNMTGWRLGFVTGNPLLVNAFAHVKDNCDSGQFMAIQKAGIAALRNLGITRQIRAKYKRKLKLLVQALQSLGFPVKMPAGGFYLYVRSPRGIRGGASFKSAEAASQYLITEKLISTVPWDDCGAYLRFSATFEARGAEAEKRVVKEMRSRLSELKFYF